MTGEQQDQHVKVYRAAALLWAWIAEEGLTFERWTYRDPTRKIIFIDGLGVETRDASGKIVRNAVVLR